MLELKVSVGRPTHHCMKKVRCNGAEYILPLPLETYRFLEVSEEIVLQPDQDLLIVILSGKRTSLSSFEKYYLLQEDALKYFNLKLELSYYDLALKLMTDTDSILTEIDKCRFADLLAIIRKGYDVYSKKLHSKFNRRIKKYLAISTRSEDENQQIKKLIDLIKAESTDQEAALPERKELPKKVKVEEIKRSSKVEEGPEDKQVQQVEEKPKLKPKEKTKEKPEKKEKPSEIHKDKKHQPKPVHQHEDNEEDWEDFEDVEEEEKEEVNAPIMKNNRHQHHHKKVEDDQDAWQDIKVEKFQKRKEKNNRRKHDKFDFQPSGTPSNNSEERDNDNILRYRIQRVPANLVQADKSKKKWVAKEGQESIEKKEQVKQKSPFQKPQRVKKQVAQKQVKKEVEPTPSELPQVVKIPPQQGILEKIFTFPADGNQLKLDLSKEYRIKVNSNFWIMLEKDQIKIVKDKTGYIRSGKFTSTEEALIEAQDLTISLTGASNLQDGGTPFGDPIIENFTGSDSQFFYVKQLEVYTYQ